MGDSFAASFELIFVNSINKIHDILKSLHEIAEALNARVLSNIKSFIPYHIYEDLLHPAPWAIYMGDITQLSHRTRFISKRPSVDPRDSRS